MTDLSREQIEILREHLGNTSPINQLCDMALRTAKAEAECERLRGWITRARKAGVFDSPGAPDTPEQTESERCLGCLGKSVHHTCGQEPDATPEQTYGDALAALEALADVAWNNVESHENRYVIHHSYDVVKQALIAAASTDGYKEKYHELLYAVAKKHPNESRHETALRYIQNAESDSECHVAAAPADGSE